MDPMLGLFLKFLLVTCTFGAIYIGHKYFKITSNSVVEKVVEEVVQKETGVDIEDLETTAESEEDNSTPPSNPSK